MEPINDDKGLAEASLFKALTKDDSGLPDALLLDDSTYRFPRRINFSCRSKNTKTRYSHLEHLNK